MFDVDGVLADFVEGFTRLANGLFGTKIITTLEQPSWNFRTWGLLTKNQENLTWDKLKQDPDWWRTLNPLIDVLTFTRINELQVRHEVVFCTNRMSAVAPPGRQTSFWLERHGITRPSVIVSGKKGEVARAIRATHSIDDKIENAWAVHWISDSPQTHSFLIDRPYNRIAALPEVGPSRVTRVATVKEFLDVVETE
jgi:hypothetical protein